MLHKYKGEEWKGLVGPRAACPHGFSSNHHLWTTCSPMKALGSPKSTMAALAHRTFGRVMIFLHVGIIEWPSNVSASAAPLFPLWELPFCFPRVSSGAASRGALSSAQAHVIQAGSITVQHSLPHLGLIQAAILGATQVEATSVLRSH